MDSYCDECGGDAEDHDAVEFMGNWFARCKMGPRDMLVKMIDDEVDGIMQFVLRSPDDARMVIDQLVTDQYDGWDDAQIIDEYWSRNR